MYAVIRTGGKQYRVEAGQQLRVERLAGTVGDRVEFPEVLMVGGADAVAVGTPTVAKAHVAGEIKEQGRGRKITVFKYKRKTRYRRVHGHRQLHTLLTITEIVGPDGERETYEVRRAGAPPAALEAVAEGPEVAEAEITAITEEQAVATAAPEAEPPSTETAQEAAAVAEPAPTRKAAKKAAAKTRRGTKTTSARKAPGTAARRATKTSAGKATPTAAKKASTAKTGGAKKIRGTAAPTKGAKTRSKKAAAAAKKTTAAKRAAKTTKEEP